MTQPQSVEDVRANARVQLDAMQAEREGVVNQAPSPADRSPSASPAETLNSAEASPSDPKRIAPVGRPPLIEDPEPWPHPVVGAQLLMDLEDVFARHLVLPAHASIALALWTLHTYLLNAFQLSPILAVTSATKRCGKSLLLVVLGALVPRRLNASNITPAALFRTIEKFTPTLVVDEADTFLKGKDELRGVLNSGHTRPLAQVVRCVGDNHEPRMFSTWCAKAIALIGKLATTLHDRAIEIRMQRRRPDEAVERVRLDRIDAVCDAPRRQCARWAVDHFVALAEADPDVPAALDDRAQDNWRPLLAIADEAGGDWPRWAREAALALSGSTEVEDEELGVQVLADVRTVFAAAGDPDVLPSHDILSALHDMEDRPWAAWGRSGKKMTGHAFARLLRQFGIRSAGPTRVFGKVERAYRAEAFKEAWDRFLPPVSESEDETPESASAAPASAVAIAADPAPQDDVWLV